MGHEEMYEDASQCLIEDREPYLSMDVLISSFVCALYTTNSANIT